MYYEFMIFILNMIVFIETMIGVIIWFTEVKPDVGKVMVLHGIIIAIVTTILSIGA